MTRVLRAMHRFLARLAFLLLVPFCARAYVCETAAFELIAANSPYGVTHSSAELQDGPGTYCQVEGAIANADDVRSRI